MELDRLIGAAMKDTGGLDEASKRDCQICHEWRTLITEKRKEIDAEYSKFEGDISPSLALWAQKVRADLVHGSSGSPKEINGSAQRLSQVPVAFQICGDLDTGRCSKCRRDFNFDDSGNSKLRMVECNSAIPVRHGHDIKVSADGDSWHCIECWDARNQCIEQVLSDVPDQADLEMLLIAIEDNMHSCYPAIQGDWPKLECQTRFKLIRQILANRNDALLDSLTMSKICHFLPCNACMDCVNTATPRGTISCDDDLDEFDSSSPCDCSSLESDYERSAGSPTPSLSKDDEDYENVDSDLTMYNADGTPHVVTVHLSTDQELRESILKKENNQVPQSGMWIEPNDDFQEDHCSGKMNFVFMASAT